MTTIEIFKQAKICSIDKLGRSMTVTGIDTITGSKRRRTFLYVSDKTLDKAQTYFDKDQPFTIEVDSGTKMIDLRIVTSLIQI